MCSGSLLNAHTDLQLTIISCIYVLRVQDENAFRKKTQATELSISYTCVFLGSRSGGAPSPSSNLYAISEQYL